MDLEKKLKVLAQQLADSKVGCPHNHDRSELSWLQSSTLLSPFTPVSSR